MSDTGILRINLTGLARRLKKLSFEKQNVPARM
jgi:hypothetical protein